MEALYIIVQILSLIGLFAGLIMFWSAIHPQKQQKEQSFPLLSIIIPARNEAHRLPSLLTSLQAQKWKHFDVIVVDDGSVDHTYEIATTYGAKAVKSNPIGEMNPGKSNACAYGARHAKGEWLLFLDADVQLADQDSLSMILSTFNKQDGKGILSIQPYHRIIKPYENLSVIFNIIVLTGMNVFTIWKEKFKTAGSFGPCILCDKESYLATGGHEAAEESIMDDFALSDVFLEKDLAVTNYVGRGIINIRMYGEGWEQLIEGWTKNLAIASQSTHRVVMLLIQLWIFGVIMAVGALIVAFLTESYLAIGCSVICYLIYGAHVYFLARRAGNFRISVLFFYPLFVLFFTAIFLYSLYRTHVLHSVMWKGRKIKV
ncbi:glycosyltransferase family 2 protein [Fredinandcohnia sp. QZ13]|uniref:glycosyltransferase n=1 Tax=Fredinandcohnia sp. QZ13 TaxID=3073144 RepID=UPI0028532FB9|nr:glycosyltransferase family 2 protein [Fredinandcohnia sp. QZ13]MDR4890453.1 glycosyltransferase family 2 protein [Fredinandcohnia sp. QZ13]